MTLDSGNWRNGKAKPATLTSSNAASSRNSRASPLHHSGLYEPGNHCPKVYNVMSSWGLNILNRYDLDGECWCSNSENYVPSLHVPPKAMSHMHDRFLEKDSQSKNTSFSLTCNRVSLYVSPISVALTLAQRKHLPEHTLGNLGSGTFKQICFVPIPCRGLTGNRVCILFVIVCFI